MGIVKTLFDIHYSTFFRPEKFHCKLDLGGSIYYKIWDRPGGWMNKSDINLLIEDIRTIAISGQEKKEIPDYGVLKADTNDLKNRVITIAYRKKDNRPVGFAAQIFLDVTVGLNVTPVLHLGLVYVAKDFQKKSILGMLYILPNILLLLKGGFRPIWISNVSQVPAIIGIVADYYDEVYPNPIKEQKQSLMQKSLSTEIMEQYRSSFGTGEDATFDPTKHIIYNSYTGGSDNLKKSFEECPKYRNEEVNIFCKNNLNYDRGDDVIQIGLLSGKLIHRFFAKRVAGVSRVQWISYLFAAGIFTITLPVLRWLTRKKA